ncbi:hypothetical protein [Nostoc sphaeroides]|uniref:Uncharacterized protein n=1 Tax=Nostoc sphaeroides CCNUC1 TaxID=2653204 RepID=A0A5P8WH92_9NOSO|nr:hypothetical protein [Nostoc sphaeroides]QFS52064.1 hypothetical protein GXM_09558 [Nostoc sphaeroides CCNUC1]
MSVINNIEFPTQVTDTTLQGIPQTLNQIESPATLGWKGLKLKLEQGLDSAGSFYQQLVSTIGSAVGVADGEPYWNGSEGAMALFGLTSLRGVRLWCAIG